MPNIRLGIWAGGDRVATLPFRSVGARQAEAEPNHLVLAEQRGWRPIVANPALLVLVRLGDGSVDPVSTSVKLCLSPSYALKNWAVATVPPQPCGPLKTAPLLGSSGAGNSSGCLSTSGIVLTSGWASATYWGMYQP